jgi:hypothetical protein
MVTRQRNHYQAQTTATKLRGQYYTPAELVAMMLDELLLAPGDLLIDPACGDGSFLLGAVAALARRFPAADREALAATWAGRLVGFDVDAGAVAEARAGLRAAFCRELGVEVAEESLRVLQADVLGTPDLGLLLERAEVTWTRAGARLHVVGNPPYVEAKRLARETTAALKRRYPDAVTGAPDLYLYFLHVCLGWLRSEDRLAFVLPNKLLVNVNAQRLRERLLDEERLRGLWFATQARIFPDASVYPIVLFASGSNVNGHKPVETARITRAAAGGVTQGERLPVDPACYGRTQARALFPPPETPVLRQALEALLALLDSGVSADPAALPGSAGVSPASTCGRDARAPRLADVMDIRWAVSFHRAGLRETYVIPERPDTPCARPFLGGGSFSGNGEVTRYRVEWAGWWIRYDTGALRAERNPLPDLGMFERPKVVICQNGRTLRAAFDEQGYVLKDTFLCGAIREAAHPLCRQPRAIVGLLCSRAVHFFYAHVFYGGHVNGGYLHFLRSFLVDIPVGNWSDERAAEVAGLVRQREEAGSLEECLALEGRIEARVSEALGLSAEQRQAIADWAAADPNWQARERVRAPRLLNIKNTKDTKDRKKRGTR